MKYEKATVQAAIERFIELTDNGKRQVYAKVIHVSSSGMSRRISYYVAVNGKIICLDYEIAVIIGASTVTDGVRVGGCGMDMAFHTLYNVCKVTGINENMAQHYGHL